MKFLLKFKLFSLYLSFFWIEKQSIHFRNLTLVASENSVNLNGLQPITTYQIRIIAVNELGQSEPSDVIYAQTDEETPGGPPLHLKAIALSSTSIKVSVFFSYILFWEIYSMLLFPIESLLTSPKKRCRGKLLAKSFNLDSFKDIILVIDWFNHHHHHRRRLRRRRRQNQKSILLFRLHHHLLLRLLQH